MSPVSPTQNLDVVVQECGRPRGSAAPTITDSVGRIIRHITVCQRLQTPGRRTESAQVVSGLFVVDRCHPPKVCHGQAREIRHGKPLQSSISDKLYRSYTTSSGSLNSFECDKSDRNLDPVTGIMSSNGMRATMSPSEASTKRPPIDKAADFANYFCTYAFLYHQKEMLSDRVRMEAYYNAIHSNAKHFKGKVVLDVGTGSGILAIWSAQAGARKVYAVEATNMAQHAATLAKANGVEHVVEVMQGSIEDLTLPEKVDVIISEWMGYFLVRESMLDSVIVARDRWLKPDGKMYPSHARMWLAPIRTGLGEQKSSDFHHSMAEWHRFCEETRGRFGVSMNCLSREYEEEQHKFFLQTSLWNNLYPNQVVGQPALVAELDCKTVSVAQIEHISANFSMALGPGPVRVAGLAGWFDVHFRGSAEDPADVAVELTTAPHAESSTHWGQQVFLLQPNLSSSEGEHLSGSIVITRSARNHRLMDVKIRHALELPGQYRRPEVEGQFHIE